MHKSYAQGYLPESRVALTHAFTLLEIIVIVAIIAILAGAMAPLAFQRLTVKRSEITKNKLLQLKKAIIGDPHVIDSGGRTSFGYIGDMGSMPTKLEDLYIRGTQPAYVYNEDLKVGTGWRGPYSTLPILEDLEILELDGYGHELAYSSEELIDVQVGVPAVGKVASLGPDRKTGGGNDLSAAIFRSEVFSNVFGFVKDPAGNSLSGITVKINYPSKGNLAQSITTTDNTGFFSFENIPHGIRTIGLKPGLTYASGSARAVGNFRNGIELNINNLSPQDVEVEWVEIYFDFSFYTPPTARYLELRIAGIEGIPKGIKNSGQRVWFNPPLVIKGNGGISSEQNYVVRVQESNTYIPELRIENFLAGDTIKVEMKWFGRGNQDLNISGIPVEVLFSNGSRIFFTPY